MTRKEKEEILNCYCNSIDDCDDWNPSLKSHKDTYNSFIQWYDKQLQHMNKEELVNMLKCIITDIEEDSLTEKKIK